MRTHTSQHDESSKCPHCGNNLELVLGCMSFGDPVVYKCAHCRYTIAYPGTTYKTDYGVYIPMWSKIEPIINLEDGEVKLTGKIQGLIGREYKISVWDKDAFRISRRIKKIHPEEQNADITDVDEAIVEYSLKPLKTGLFSICEENYLQGLLMERLIHYILVE